MTDVTIIPIDLGDINALIAEDVAELTGKAAETLENAISTQKALQAVRDKKQQEKAAEETALTTLMDAIYQKLVDAGESGALVNDIISQVTPIIATPSAFSLRMKHVLKTKGNPYAMVRKQRKGVAYYIFIPFNQPASEEPGPVSP
jgi:hypothetical protein